MKKLVLLFAAFVLAITLAACNRDPSDLEVCLEDPTAPECQTACPEGQELVGTVCLDVCPEGEHREGESCVVDTITCPAGQHEENGACVVTETRTPEEIAIDFIIDGYDGDMTFLSTAMVNMHFEEALTMTTEFNFEITEDIDEVHYIEAIITDSFVYDETNGDKVKRDIFLDVDNEFTIQFAVILHEVPTGVHVYIEAAPIIALATEDNTDALNTLNWVGFDDQWAVFELDDSLQNVIELSVLKDMVVALFFSEMGDTFFTDVQENHLEELLGFDLSQYNVDLGLLVDTIIEEDWDAVETQIDGIEFENIGLHLDAMYVAPYILELVEDKETELRAASFEYDTLVPLLQVSTYNATTEMYEAFLPVDPLEGTEAFFEAMDQNDMDQFVELVLKPFFEETVYQVLDDEINPDWLDDDMHDIIIQNSDFINMHWPETSDPWDSSAHALLVDTIGAVDYWRGLTEEEQSIIHWSVDMEYHGWVVHHLQESYRNEWQREYFLRRHEEHVDIDYLEQEFVAFILANDTEFMNDYSIDVDVWATEINNTMRFMDWYHELDWNATNAITVIVKQAGNEMYEGPVLQLDAYYYDWNYDYNVNFRGEFWRQEWLTNDLQNMINSHASYLQMEYNINGTQLVDDIEMYGALEWYFSHSSEYEREALEDISHFNGYYGDHTWLMENIERMYQNQGDLYFWFGTDEQKDEIEWLTEYAQEYLVNINPWMTGNTVYDTSVWSMEIETMGLIDWWDQLDNDELQAFQDSFDNASVYPRWAIERLMQRDEEPEMFDVCYGSWSECQSVEMLDEYLYELVNDYGMYIDTEYAPFDTDTILDDIDMYGAIEFYMNHATEQEMEILDDIAEKDYWQYEVIWKIDDILDTEEGFLEFLEAHETEFNTTTTFDATAAITYIETNGLQMYVDMMLTPADLEILFDAYLYPVVEDFHQAVLDDELPEFFMNEFFTNQHVTAALTEIGVNPVFDHTIIAANMIVIDFDALEVELETFDFEALVQPIRDGETAFDAHVATLTTFPNMQNILEVFSPAVGSLEEYMIYVDDVEYAFESLELFDQFIDLEYYLDEIVDVEMERTADTELLIEFEVDGIGYAQLFSDFVDQAGIYLYGFQTLEFPFDDEWNCVNPVDCEEPDFASVIAHLTTLGETSGHILYDPYDLTWMELGLDLTDFLDQIVAQEYADMVMNNPGYTPDNENDDWTGVNELSIVVTMSNTSAITLPAPAVTDNVNEIVDDFGKFGITMEAYEILKDYADYYEMNPVLLIADLYNTPVYLEDIEFMRFSAAFDLEMSYITIVVPMLPNPVPGQPDIPDLVNMDYEIVLYWIDETLVHDNPVGIADIMPLWLDGELVSEAGYDTLVGMVNDTNWHMMKLFTYFMWEDFDPEIELD